MTDQPDHAKMKLIERYTKIQTDLQASVENRRPVCQALAGDLMALADQLHCTEVAETWLRELQERSRPNSTGPFSGVTG